MNIRHRGDSARSITLKKIAVYGGMLFLLAIAQCSFFANLTFLPATPNIVIGAITAISMLESRHTATVFSLCAGFVIDALGGSGIPLSTLIMLLFSIILTSLAAKMLKNLLVWSLILTLSCALSTLATYLRLLAAGYVKDIYFVFIRISLPEFLLTLLFSLPLYFLFKAAVKFCNSKGKFKI